MQGTPNVLAQISFLLPLPDLLITSPTGTDPEELDHLESVLNRVCQLHVADTKPMQVPGPDQVRGRREGEGGGGAEDIRCSGRGTPLCVIAQGGPFCSRMLR